VSGITGSCGLGNYGIYHVAQVGEICVVKWSGWCCDLVPDLVWSGAVGCWVWLIVPGGFGGLYVDL
jgi:hypothetical protein